MLPLVQITILLLMFIGVKKRNSQYITNVEIMTYKQTCCVKGFMAIMVMLGHFAKDMEGIAMFALNKAGVLCVGIFFFLSGYGLMQSTKNTENYNGEAVREPSSKKIENQKVGIIKSKRGELDFNVSVELDEKRDDQISQNEFQTNCVWGGYIRKRLKKVIVPLLLCWLIVGIIKYFIGIYEIKDIFSWRNFFEETNWFVYAILVLYALYYFVFNKTELFLGYKILWVLLLLINIALYFSPLDRIYYGGNICFGLGVGFSLFYEVTIKKIRKHILFYSAIVLCMFIGGTFLYLKYGKGSFLGDWIGRNVATIAVVSLLVLFLQGYRWENVILKYLGYVSYEIYLVHLSVISVLEELQIMLKNDSLGYYIISFVISVIGAHILHIFCNSKSLIRMWRKIF